MRAGGGWAGWIAAIPFPSLLGPWLTGLILALLVVAGVSWLRGPPSRICVSVWQHWDTAAARDRVKAKLGRTSAAATRCLRIWSATRRSSVRCTDSGSDDQDAEDPTQAIDLTSMAPLAQDLTVEVDPQ